MWQSGNACPKCSEPRFQQLMEPVRREWEAFEA